MTEGPVTREEAARLAKEYRNYADKMPNDAYQHRWRIIGAALDFYSKHGVDETAES